MPNIVSLSNHNGVAVINPFKIRFSTHRRTQGERKSYFYCHAGVPIYRDKASWVGYNKRCLPPDPSVVILPPG